MPRTGFEPARCYSLPPQSSASASSATWAWLGNNSWFCGDVEMFPRTGLRRFRLERDVFVVNALLRERGEAVTDGLFVGGMDILRVAHVDGDGHADVGKFTGDLRLRLAQSDPIAGAAFEIRQLNKQKREIPP